MLNFTVNVISENDDKRVPVAVAGQMMVDIQCLLSHVGEYLMAKELGIQESLEPRLLNKLTIYIDSAGGISLNTSSYVPETEGYGNIVDDAVILMERTLDALGSGTGSYWMEDNYDNPIYRNDVIVDVVSIYQHINALDGMTLLYGSGKDLKKFGKVDLEKLAYFVREKGLASNGSTCGLIDVIPSKSRHDSVYLIHGSNKVRLSFTDDETERKTEEFVGKGPVIVSGILTYSNEAKLIKIVNVGVPTPMTSVRFHRMVASTGDVELKSPVDATVEYEDDTWILTNKDLGIVVTKPTWDGAVQQFHDYLVFLWTQYTEKEDSRLSDEEREVKDFLLALIA